MNVVLSGLVQKWVYDYTHSKHPLMIITYTQQNYLHACQCVGAGKSILGVLC